MPGLPSRVCSYPGCIELSHSKTGRCEAHPRLSGWSDPHRGTRHERGYGGAWDKLRLRILERDKYVCQCEECQGGRKRTTPATEVDHRIPKSQGGTDDPSNLQAINRDCHKRKTQRESLANRR